MGMSTKELGGGAAVGLSQDWIGALQKLLNGGGLGTAGSPDGPGTTGNIMGVLSDILSGGKGQAGSAIAQLLGKQQERDVNSLRARFTQGGGTAFGTPAAFAESLYRAEAAPQITQAITGLQLQAIAPLLSAMTGLSQLGIAPRQLVQERSGLGQAFGTLVGAGQAALPFVLPAFPNRMPGAPSMAGLPPLSQVLPNPLPSTAGYIPPSYAP